MNILTTAQAVTLMDTCEGDRIHALIVLADTTGLRQGELFDLHWIDIDWGARKLSVQCSLIEVAGDLSYGKPKCKAGLRTVMLPLRAVDALKALRSIRLREGLLSENLVFSDTKDNPLRKSNFYHNWCKPLLKRAGGQSSGSMTCVTRQRR